jgi:thiaminase/transcriptional activator TenA
VKQQQRATSPWQAFIENWTSSTFCEYVEWLGHTLDGLAYGVPDSLRAAMRELFLTTAQYELRFWDMAWRGEQWPVDMS